MLLKFFNNNGSVAVCEEDKSRRKNEGTFRVGQREVEAMIDDS